MSEWIEGDTIDQLLKRADLALYAAKSAGRNRVVAADAEACARLTANPNSVVRARGRSDYGVGRAEAIPIAVAEREPQAASL